MNSKYIKISKEETYDLIKRAQEGDLDARELVVMQNTGLVKSLAVKFVNTGYELDDLLQLGFIGLIKAIDKFDFNYQVMFSTYAVPMILGEIKRFIRDDGKIKVSRRMKLDMRNLKAFQDEFYNTHGRAPKINEISQLMGISPEEVIEVLEASEALFRIESLDNPDRAQASSEGAGDLGRSCSGISGNASSGLMEDGEKTVNLILLKSVVGKLPPRERQIIVLRYFKDMTQQQVAVNMGISQVQVSRIEKKILKKIKEEFKE